MCVSLDGCDGGVERREREVFSFEESPPSVPRVPSNSCVFCCLPWTVLSGVLAFLSGEAIAALSDSCDGGSVATSFFASSSAARRLCAELGLLGDFGLRSLLLAFCVSRRDALSDRAIRVAADEAPAPWRCGCCDCRALKVASLFRFCTRLWRNRQFNQEQLPCLPAEGWGRGVFESEEILLSSETLLAGASFAAEREDTASVGPFLEAAASVPRLFPCKCREPSEENAAQAVSSLVIETDLAESPFWLAPFCLSPRGGESLWRLFGCVAFAGAGLSEGASVSVLAVDSHRRPLATREKVQGQMHKARGGDALRFDLLSVGSLRRQGFVKSIPAEGIPRPRSHGASLSRLVRSAGEDGNTNSSEETQFLALALDGLSQQALLALLKPLSFNSDASNEGLPVEVQLRRLNVRPPTLRSIENENENSERPSQVALVQPGLCEASRASLVKGKDGGKCFLPASDELPAVLVSYADGSLWLLHWPGKDNPSACGAMRLLDPIQ